MALQVLRAITWSTDEALSMSRSGEATRPVGSQYPRGNDFVITRWFYCSGRADQPKYLQTAAPTTCHRHLGTKRDGD